MEGKLKLTIEAENPAYYMLFIKFCQTEKIELIKEPCVNNVFYIDEKDKTKVEKRLVRLQEIVEGKSTFKISLNQKQSTPEREQTEQTAPPPIDTTLKQKKISKK